MLWRFWINMRISTRSRYGLRLMLQLADNYGKGPVQLNYISEKEEISLKYLGQIIIQLKSAGLVSSMRGSQGGYILTRPPKDITLLDIVQKLEGDANLIDCVDDNLLCNRSYECIVRDIWKSLSDEFQMSLKKITLLSILEKKNKKNTNFEYDI